MVVAGSNLFNAELPVWTYFECYLTMTYFMKVGQGQLDSLFSLQMMVLQSNFLIQNENRTLNF